MVEFLLQLESVLWDIALGLLISGGLLVLLSVIFNIESLADAFGIGDHDISLDHDVSLDHDISVDHDVSLDHDISVDHDVSLDHDVSIDHDISAEHDVSADHDVTTQVSMEKIGFKDITESSAPLFLLFSTYFLIFGILGVTTLKIETSSLIVRIIRLIAIFLVPFVLARVVSLIWRKISRTTSIPIKKGQELIGELATVYVSVDSKGGIIEVDLGKPTGIVKLPAKSFNFYQKFNRGDIVRIVAVKKNEYLVDIASDD